MLGELEKTINRSVRKWSKIYFLEHVLKGKNMHECETCGFKTGRLDAFKRHLNRKKPCKREEGVVPSVVPSVVPNGQNVVPNGQNVVPNVVPNGSSVVPSVVPKLYGSVPKKVANKAPKQSVVQPAVQPPVQSVQSSPETEKKNNHSNNLTSNSYNCEICGMIFSNRQNRHRHVKRGNCKPPPTPIVCEPIFEMQPSQWEGDVTTSCPHCDRSFSRLDNLKRHVAKCNGTGGNVTNNTMTTNTNCNNTSVNYTINYNSYDKPCIDHVTKEQVKELYLGNNRNLKKLIHAGVCEIWKKKENNSFRLPFHDEGKGIPKRFFRDNETIEVFADGQERLFPADHVVEVVLQKAAEVVESFLRQHHNEETIVGTGVLKHANVLEELACDFQEVWDDDKVFRSMYKPFVRTALLECMRERQKAEEKERAEKGSLKEFDTETGEPD